MTLRLKVHLIVGVMTLLFLAAVIGLLWRNLRDSVAEETLAANRVAAQLLNRTAWLYAAQGTPAMLHFLHGLGRVRSNDVTLYDAAGSALYRSPPSPYKAGRDAPAWFAPLISPAPVEQAIEFPDGRLVVRANASRAVLDAWDSLRWIAGGAALLLLAVNAVLYGVVGRTVRPFSAIVQAMRAVQDGRLDTVLPPLPGREAGAIGTAFNRMAGELQRQRETERRALRAETELSDSRALARWVDHHIEQERRAFARELHDEFGQSVTAIRSMALSVANRTAADPTAAQAARTIADEASRLYESMHGIIPRLAPLVLDSFGLADAIRDLVERTQRNHPALKIDLQLELADTPLPPDAALTLYRAAQEGITNALQHGGATHMQLSLGCAGQTLRLELLDNGSGLPPEGTARPGHYGLRWLLERVAALAGTLAVEPRQPRGARLVVAIPMPREAT